MSGNRFANGAIYKLGPFFKTAFFGFKVGTEIASDFHFAVLVGEKVTGCQLINLFEKGFFYCRILKGKIVGESLFI